MSSDMMIVCKEDKSDYYGKYPELAIFVDECSMGEPFTDFGKWFRARYCGMPSVIEEMHGYEGTDWLELTKMDVVAIEMAIGVYSFHNKMKEKEVKKYLDTHIGKSISTENW